MSMFSDYLRELDGREVIANSGSFLTYLIVNHQFFITDFYIKPEFRKSSKVIRSLMNVAYAHAVKNNCSWFTCKISVGNNNVNEVLLLRLKFGFKITAAINNEIHLSLPLEECKQWVRL